MNSEAGVIFDMDGVLVDTYQAHFLSWREMAASEGLSMSEEDFARSFGRTSREIIALLWGGRGYSPQQIAELDERKEEAFRRLIARDFPAMPGARELIAALAEHGVKMAIGSSGPPANVELVVEHLGCRELLSGVVTGADVTRGKPDPQVFLMAAERLGLPPARCVVVEDAQPGIAAAHAAGAAAIGLVSTGRRHEELSAADLVVDALGELSPPRIAALIESRQSIRANHHL
jgi:beta-phosphoglucomutase